MKVITVAIQKGGSGKTTTSYTLGSYLKTQGYRVLFIDLDSQRSLSLCSGANNKEVTSFEVLSNACKVEDAIIKTRNGDVIPASQNLSIANNLFTETGKEYKLKEAIEPLINKYDYCIIDTPPALGVLTINALTVADLVIIPAQAEVFSIEGLALLNQSIEVVKKYTNPKIKIGGVLITRYDKRTNFSKSALDLIRGYSHEINTKVYESQIREAIAIKESQALQQSIFEYDPKGKVTQDYINFSQEVMKQLGE